MIQNWFNHKLIMLTLKTFSMPLLCVIRSYGKAKKGNLVVTDFRKCHKTGFFFDKFLFAAKEVLTVTNQFEKAKETLAAMTNCTIATWMEIFPKIVVTLVYTVLLLGYQTLPVRGNRI